MKLFVMSWWIGVTVPAGCRLLYGQTSASHAFVQAEQMMPILPFVRCETFEQAVDFAKQAEHGFRHTAVMHSLNVEHLHAYARVANTSIFVKNAPAPAGLGFGGEGYTSWTIASPTGEGLTTAINYTRERRCVLTDYFRIV